MKRHLITILNALLGALVMTVICWGALYLYGTVYLKGYGSLFDTNPSAANLFFMTWGGLSIASGIVCAYITQQKHKEKAKEDIFRVREK